MGNNNYRDTATISNTDTKERMCDDDYYYGDERIMMRTGFAFKDLPEPIRTVRYMGKAVSSRNLSRQELFLQQALFMADYEDDYVYNKEVVRYYPTYQSLSDRELRAYFSWRTKWRKGDLHETSLSFAFIYVYELLHLVGCASAQDAYDKLAAFARDYAVFSPKITAYLNQWIRDFVVYYELDPNLLADTKEVHRDNALFVLIDMQNRSDSEIFRAVLELSNFVLKNSRFFKKYPKAMEGVIAGTLRQLESHYAKSCKKVWTESYFGTFLKKQVKLFNQAVFFDQLKKKKGQADLSPLCHYRCVNGIWFLYSCEYNRFYHKRFLNLLRTIDAMLRDAVNFPYAVQPKIKTKWLIGAINEEIAKWQEAELRAKQKQLEQQTKKKKVHFDLSQLGAIRSEANETSEKLLTEEEREKGKEEAKEQKEKKKICEKNASIEKICADENENNDDDKKNNANDDNDVFRSLTEQEKRYLQCLLNKTPTDWLAKEGLLSSLLCDSINEKLYDLFEDNVLEHGILIEDYREELKDELKKK